MNLDVTYKYNDSGILTQKTVNGVTTTYHLEGTKAIYEQTGSNLIYYCYDENGQVIGMEYNNSKYYYVKNAQGDIIGLLDSNLNQVASYIYNSWGKVVSVKYANGNEITDQNNIAHINPYRYRGYRYDNETGLYYLQSRYYNPEWGRFLNADGLVSTGTGIVSHNMYAYCGNNPVNMCDPNGEFPFLAALLITSLVIGLIANIVASIPQETWQNVGESLGSAIESAVDTGKKIVSSVKNKITSSTKNTTKTVTQTTTVTNTRTKPNEDIVIYRYGGSNPGNLTPRQKDYLTGLSFSLIPMPGSAMTTIKALNATGAVYAVQDTPFHVSVKPVGVSIQTWINAGSNSIWTQAVKSVVIKWDGGR